MEMPIKVIFPLIIPFLSLIAILSFSSSKKNYFVSLLFLILSMLILFFSRADKMAISVTGFPFGFYSGDPYSSLVRFAFSLTGSLVLLYAASKKDRIFQLVSIWAVSSAVLLTLAENYLTFFLFWEMLSISTAALIFIQRTERSNRNGWRYLLTHLTGGLLFLMGVFINYQATGSLMLRAPEAGIPFFVLAVGIKTAFIPFHYWLPAGYPSSSFQGSVLLSALSTKAGVYALARILEPSLAVAYMGGFMAIFGVIMALLQKKMRPLLAYHIISQVGYMVAGVGLGVSMSIDGGLFHLLNHMLYKALLFMSAGAVLFAVGTEKFTELGGLWKKVPFAAAVGLIGSLAIAGVPPFNGFISKTMLKYGVEQQTLLSVLLTAASVGTAISFSKFMFFGFLKSKEQIDLKVREIPLKMKIPMIAGSFLVILIGIYPQFLKGLIPYQSSIQLYSYSSVLTGFITSGSGVLLFIIFRRLLSPERITIAHRIHVGFNRYIDQMMGILLDLLQSIGRKEEYLTFDRSMLFLLYSITIISLVYLSNLLFR